MASGSVVFSLQWVNVNEDGISVELTCGDVSDVCIRKLPMCKRIFLSYLSEFISDKSNHASLGKVLASTGLDVALDDQNRARSCGIVSIGSKKAGFNLIPDPIVRSKITGNHPLEKLTNPIDWLHVSLESERLVLNVFRRQVRKEHIVRSNTSEVYVTRDRNILLIRRSKRIFVFRLVRRVNHAGVPDFLDEAVASHRIPEGNVVHYLCLEILALDNRTPHSLATLRSKNCCLIGTCWHDKSRGLLRGLPSNLCPNQRTDKVYSCSNSVSRGRRRNQFPIRTGSNDFEPLPTIIHFQVNVHLPLHVKP